MPQITLKRPQMQQLADFAQKHDLKKWFLAKDQGAYVGASAGKEGNCIFFFRGCDPARDPEWWDNARNAFGGDDFGMHFDFDSITRALSSPTVNRMVVKVTATRVSVSFFAK